MIGSPLSLETIVTLCSSQRNYCRTTKADNKSYIQYNNKTNCTFECLLILLTSWKNGWGGVVLYSVQYGACSK